MRKSRRQELNLMRNMVRQQSSATTNPMELTRTRWKLEEAKGDVWCQAYKRARAKIQQMKYLQEMKRQAKLCYICIASIRLWDNYRRVINDETALGDVPLSVCEKEYLFPAAAGAATKPASFLQLLEHEGARGTVSELGPPNGLEKQSVDAEKTAAGKPVPPTMVHQWGLTSKSHVLCGGEYLKPTEADKDADDKYREALKAPQITKKGCDALVETLKKELRTKVYTTHPRMSETYDGNVCSNCGCFVLPDCSWVSRVVAQVELLTVATGRPSPDFTKTDQGSCKPYNCSLLVNQFAQLHSAVFNDLGDVNDEFGRYVDLEYYGTPGPTACTDLHFCQSTVDEQRVMSFFSRNERFRQEMKQYDQLEKAADRPGYGEDAEGNPLVDEEGKWMRDQHGKILQHWPPGWDDATSRDEVAEAWTPPLAGNPTYLGYAVQQGTHDGLKG